MEEEDMMMEEVQQEDKEEEEEEMTGEISQVQLAFSFCIRLVLLGRKNRCLLERTNASCR